MKVGDASHLFTVNPDLGNVGYSHSMLAMLTPIRAVCPVGGGCWTWNLEILVTQWRKVVHDHVLIP